MSKYTTGEIAKLCGVSVRTVQYYDTRGILTPSNLTEGGRRLYSEADLKQMRIICFLRETGLPINSIAALLADEYPEKTIVLLLDQQEQVLQEEVQARSRQLDMIADIRQEMKVMEHVTVESIGDIAYVMEGKKKLRRLRLIALLPAIPIGVLEWTSIFLWILKGIWQPFAVYAVLGVAYAVWLMVYYFNRVHYICPECHEIFKPRLRDVFWAWHSRWMRRLTCPACGQKRFCVEVYAGKETEHHG